MRPYLVFDVNETLLDLSALDPHFNAYFGEPSIRDEWFSQVLLSAFTLTILGTYHHFGHVARAALTMLSEKYNIALSEEGYTSILGQMRELPPHGDVLAALERLKEDGLRMAALTNSPYDVACDQLEHAGITPYLETVLSVDASRALKPSRIVYEDAARALNIEPHNLFMVAAHPWDIAGAMKAGWQGIFILRSGKVWNPLYNPPSYRIFDLIEIKDILES